MKLFRNVEQMRAEIQSMENDERDRREDRATVSAFFNGKPPITQAAADAMGLKVNVNNLFGYTDLATSKEAQLALYTKPARLWTTSIEEAPAWERERWEMGVAKLLNKMVKKYGKLKIAYEGVAGDATLHGEGEFWFPDPTTPIPRQLPLSQRLIPKDAPADARELTHFAVVHKLTLEQICWHIRNESEGWDLATLRQIRQKAFSELDQNGKWTGRLQGGIDQMNPEEVEYARQGQGDIDKAFRHHVPVYYFFQTDPDKDGCPVDLDIVLKNDDSDQPAIGKGKSIYTCEEFYSSTRECIHPFFMDCILGGEPKWHRVKGQGHLNYSIAWHVEMLLCRLMQGAQESSQNWWTVENGAAREELEKFLLKHNAIVPEGIGLLPNRAGIDLQQALSVLSIFQQRAARNSRQAFSNNADEGGQKELQVQAMFRQSAITAQQSSRLANWYESKSALGAEILTRYTNPNIKPFDRAYSEVKEFQAGLRRLGIPLYWVQPFNVTVNATRITGDGDDMKARSSATFFMQNMAMYPPESQQRLKRIVTAIMADDYQLAEELIPIGADMPADQVRDADSENNTAIIQGRPPGLNDKDIDEVHVETHFKGLGSILQQAQQLQQETFTPQQLMAFKALGAHTLAHIKRMQSMGKAEPARAYLDAMNQLSSMAEKFRHNLEQKQQAAAEEQGGADPVEAARLELEQSKLNLAAQKQEFAKYKFERVQAGKEHGGAIDQSIKLATDARAEDAHQTGKAAEGARLQLEAEKAAREAIQPPVAAAA